MPENIKFNVIFKDGLKLVSKIEGKKDMERKLGLADVNPEKIIETEQFLEKLTGYRVHIEQEF
jgi:hypothetical protein